jgi:hypothetical protein
MSDFNNQTVKAAKGFEPIEAFDLNATTERALKVTALMSIAISLKRIADSMCGKHHNAVVMTAEEYATYKAQLETDGNSRY